jgi:hypothetical protein
VTTFRTGDSWGKTNGEQKLVPVNDLIPNGTIIEFVFVDGDIVGEETGEVVGFAGAPTEAYIVEIADKSHAFGTKLVAVPVEDIR